MQTTDAQVRKLMKEIRKTGKVEESALRSGMSRNNAPKAGLDPSGLWRLKPNNSAVKAMRLWSFPPPFDNVTRRENTQAER